MGRLSGMIACAGVLVLGALVAPAPSPSEPIQPAAAPAAEATAAGATASPASLRRTDAEPVGERGDTRFVRIAGETRIETAVEVARDVAESATVAVLATALDFPDALAGAPLAGDREGPLLLTHRDQVPPAVHDALGAMGVEEVVLLGGPAAIDPAVQTELEGRVRVTRVSGDDRFATAAAVARALPPADRVYVATGDDYPDALSVGPLAAHTGTPVLLVTRDEVPAPTQAVLDELSPSEVVIIGGTAVVSEGVADSLGGPGRTVRRIAGDDRYGTAVAVADEARAAGLGRSELWAATGRAFPDALAAGPAAAAVEAGIVLVDGGCLHRSGPALDRLRGDLELVVLLGGPQAITDAALEQLDGVPCPPELPRGGRSIHPEYRLVGLYGNARSAAMGSLGEQPPEQAVTRLMEQAAPYEAGDRPVLPVFELIVTVATSGPGDDGMYRRVGDPADVQRYLDVARQHGIYLLLDIQPGRSDFLTEVRRYERFLREPDVGIALDSEWRMGPNEVPGRQIGSVDAAEVNEVSAYVADLVAQHDLPEKLFVIHQFRQDMVTNRDQIEMRDGLAVNFHIDGFGSRAQKLNTYGNLTPVPPGAWVGFKLFYDEDTDIFQPHEALGIEPVPDLITYQ